MVAERTALEEDGMFFPCQLGMHKIISDNFFFLLPPLIFSFCLNNLSWKRERMSEERWCSFLLCSFVSVVLGMSLSGRVLIFGMFC